MRKLDPGRLQYNRRFYMEKKAEIEEASLNWRRVSMLKLAMFIICLHQLEIIDITDDNADVYQEDSDDFLEGLHEQIKQNPVLDEYGERGIDPIT